MKKIFLFLLFIIPSFAYSQWVHEDLLSNPALDTTYSNKFSFQVDAIGFLKNNEYSTPFVKGETFPGAKFTPKFGYQIDNKFRFEIGSSGLYYSGDQKTFGKRLFSAIHLRMQYDIEPNLHFLLGNYYGGVNHQLIEPLYRWERHLVDNPESGVQLIYRDQKYFADVWVNWQRFIERNDPLQEVLTFGISSSVKLTKPSDAFSVTVPFQLVINHKGGQIDTSDKRNLVIGNIATGLQMNYIVDRDFIKSLDFNLYLAGYYDNVPIKEVRRYDFGWGAYPTFTINASEFKFMTGYWHGEKFYSVEGEPLFASFNHLYPGESLKVRNLLTNKVSYTKRLMKMLSVGAQAELYTDLDRGKVDYSFGVHMRFDLPGVKWKW